MQCTPREFIYMECNMLQVWGSPVRKTGRKKKCSVMPQTSSLAIRISHVLMSVSSLPSLAIRISHVLMSVSSLPSLAIRIFHVIDVCLFSA